MSIFRPVENFAKKAIKTVTKVANKTVNRIDSTANALINGRDKYGPVIQQFLNQYGNAIVTHIQIVRNPINSAVQGALNVVSNGAVNALPYDKLFHLSLNLTTNMGTLNIEKNQFIQMRKIQQHVIPGGAVFDIPNILNISLHDLLENGRRYATDKRWFNYNASSQNCQSWCLWIIDSNHLLTPATQNFIKQDTSSVFSGDNGRTRKIANSVVDLGKVSDILASGGSLKHYGVFKSVANPLH